jgi:hypothetical protein
MHHEMQRPTFQVRDAAGWGGLAFVVGTTAWLFSSTPGTPDVDIWISWIRTTLSDGPVHGYALIAADYPPLASLFLWITGHVALAEQIDPRLAIKLLLSAFLTINTLLVLLITRRPWLAAFAHGALATSAMGLMYLDILTAPFITVAMWAAVAGRLPLMLGLIGVATMVKWQPIIVVPFALTYVVMRRKTSGSGIPFRSVLVSALPVAGPAVAATAIYGFPVIESFYRASRHSVLSAFGANIPWLMTWWLGRDSAERITSGGIVATMYASRLTLRLLTLTTLVAYTWTLRTFWKQRDRSVGAWLKFSLIGYLAYFVFSAGVHENHLFLASVLAIGLACVERGEKLVAWVMAIAANLNVLAFYGWYGYVDRSAVLGVDVTVLLAVGVCGALGMSVYRMRREGFTGA